MEVMYLKYIHGIRHSIIKEGGNIIMNDSKIIPFKPEEKIEVNKSTLLLILKKIVLRLHAMIKLMKKLLIFSLMLYTKIIYLVEKNSDLIPNKI